NVMRDMMLVNVSGIDGHAMPIDINMEHKIGNVKELLVAKGLTNTWDRLGDIGATINLLSTIKKKIQTSLGTRYRGISHTTPDTSDLVWKVANHCQDHGLQEFRPGREHNALQKCIPDILAVGTQKLLSSTLGTFNKQRKSLVTGIVVEDTEIELDEGPELGITFSMLDVDE
ncbi:hypothetical protein PLICRDRAFT_119739, partial [Plicaturopsis crispa FD-325 SS-3]